MLKLKTLKLKHAYEQLYTEVPICKSHKQLEIWPKSSFDENS